MDDLYKNSKIYLERKHTKFLEFITQYNAFLENKKRKCNMCNNKHQAKGLCKFHYQKEYRRGK